LIVPLDIIWFNAKRLFLGFEHKPIEAPAFVTLKISCISLPANLSLAEHKTV
jgi:hypothetical protein